MTQFILLFASEDGQTPLEREKIVHAIDSLGGSATADAADKGDVTWSLPVNDSETYPIQIRLLAQPGSLAVDTFNEVGLQAALDIQRAYLDEIYAWSEEASPLLVPLSTIKIPDELATILKLR